MSKKVELIDQLNAYWLFLQGFDLATVALAAGVTERTVRKWAESEDWQKDREWVKAMAKSLALAKLFTTWAATSSLFTAQAQGRPITTADLPRD